MDQPRRTPRQTCLIAASIAALSFLPGCESTPKQVTERPTRVEFSEDAANVFVAAYPAVPWNSISAKLEPKHALTTADARAMAAITTQAQVNQFLSTFSASLGVSLPLRTQTSITTTAADTTTTTGTRTVAPQAVPTPLASPATISDTALAPSLSAQPLALGLDGASQLQLGTGIFQLAQILDNQISQSLKPQGYEAHLITFQVNLQPIARNMPYDAYVNLTLLPASWEKAVSLTQGNHKDPEAMPPVIVYPLVISDAMESASVGRSLEVIRQAALQLSGIVSNVGIGSTIGGGSNRLESIIGSDRNSLLTVGRVSDHTLRIRLGAMQQGSLQLALVPRTHNVSVVVFTKAHKAAKELHIDKLTAITETRLVDVELGTTLKSRRSDQKWRDSTQGEVVRQAELYGFSLHKDCASSFGGLDLLSALDRGDYAEVTSCLVEKVSGTTTPKIDIVETSSLQAAEVDGIRLTPSLRMGIARPTQFVFKPQDQPDPKVIGSVPDTAREARLRRLTARLMTMQTESRYSKMMIELTRFKRQVPQLPAWEQFVTLADDGKAAASVTLRGGSALSTDLIRARLPVNQAIGKDTLPFFLMPSAITVDASGENLTIAFPSPTAAGVTSTAVNGTATHFLVEVSLLDAATLAEQSKYRYMARVATPASEKGLDSPLKSSTTIIVASQARTGRVNISIGDWDADKNGPLALAVQGADLDEGAGSKVNAEVGGVAAGKKSLVTLHLANLTTRSPVLVLALAKGKPVGQPLSFVVEPVVTRAAVAAP